MSGNCCRNCMFATPVSGGPPGLRVCVNRWDKPGQMVAAGPTDGCRNFRPRPQPPRRVEPPEPPSPDIKYIPLTQGLHAIVAAADYERLSRHKWYAQATGNRNVFYACRSHGNTVIQMHREIMKTPKGMVVDHINGNGLDNRPDNMRNCRPWQNALNRRPHGKGSKYSGVYRQGGKWRVRLWDHRRILYDAMFDDEIEAAIARDLKAHAFHGEFAWLNFPEFIRRYRAIAGPRIVRLQGTARLRTVARARLTLTRRRTRRPRRY